MQVVGKKVYLLNIIFCLVPNFTLLGKPYNPYEATFRIPQSSPKWMCGRTWLRYMVCK